MRTVAWPSFSAGITSRPTRTVQVGGAHGACGPELPPPMRARGNDQVGLVNDLPILHNLHRQRLEVVFRVLGVHDEFRSLAQAFGWLRQEDRGSLAARHFRIPTPRKWRPKRRGRKPPPLRRRVPDLPRSLDNRFLPRIEIGNSKFETRPEFRVSTFDFRPSDCTQAAGLMT